MLLPVAAPAQEEPTGVANLAAPQVTGEATYAEVLSATDGEWSTAEPEEQLTFTYRWLRDGEPMRGEREATYALDLGDLRSRLQVEVTATDPDGDTASAVSEPTAPVARAAMVLRGDPKVRGTQRFGQTLSATPGRWRSWWAAEETLHERR